MNLSQNDPTLDEMIKRAVHAAKSAMRQHGRVSPTCLFHTQEGLIGFFPETMGNLRAKDNFADIARLIATSHEATASVMIIEAWLTLPKPGNPLDVSVPPSESPDRRECILIIAEAMNETKHAMLLIRRGWKGEFICVEEKDIPSAAEGEGRFARIMPSKTPTEKERRKARSRLLLLGVAPENLGVDPLWN
jgi:hypothetical protein